MNKRELRAKKKSEIDSKIVSVKIILRTIKQSYNDSTKHWEAELKRLNKQLKEL